MKLRLLGASLRLRVTRGEVDTLADGAAVVEVVPFAAGSELRYRLLADDGVATPTATFAHGEVVVRLPRAAAQHWARSEEVGLRAEQDVGAQQALSIVVEKDFACLQPRAGEDESDMFSHPDAGTRDQC